MAVTGGGQVKRSKQQWIWGVTSVVEVVGSRESGEVDWSKGSGMRGWVCVYGRRGRGGYGGIRNGMGNDVKIMTQ